jgi:hypothetical protein
VADLLFGVVNPSGKLPTTYPRSEDDTLYAGLPERYPGTDEGDGYPVIRYSEGLEMGAAGTRPKASRLCSPSATGCLTRPSTSRTWMSTPVTRRGRPR